MIAHLPPVLAAIGPVLVWCSALILVIASLCCVIATLRTPRRPLVYTAAGLLALAIVFVSIPGPEAPALFRVLIGVVVLALSVAGGGPAAQVVLGLASRSVVAGANGGIVVPEKATPEQIVAGVRPTHEVLRGGTTIGFLERFAATGAIMAGFPEAVAVLVAIKGVGRFTELDAAEARERFIIGTLTSLVWACACAAVFRLTFA
ncbi:hypothetical protein [Leifsonia poae]|uniref:hypothetical protein n=1 Tax=Leifsonia poae TaxID=110933 RepID=UPI001CC17583|nr:hypothetical protein [Leifsonia poae]